MIFTDTLVIFERYLKHKKINFFPEIIFFRSNTNEYEKFLPLNVTWLKSRLNGLLFHCEGQGTVLTTNRDVPLVSVHALLRRGGAGQRAEVRKERGERTEGTLEVLYVLFPAC